MKILVCIKQVPDTTEIKLDPVKGTLIRTGVPSIMNPDDKGALEQALQFKDRFGAEVHVITMGPPQAKAVLYEAFGMGCDEGFLITFLVPTSRSIAPPIPGARLPGIIQLARSPSSSTSKAPSTLTST